MKPIIEVVPQLKTPKKIAITCHYRPDGDAIGSILGLYHYLCLKGHEVMPITPNEVPDFLSFLPGFESLINFEALPSKATEFIQAADYIFCLDYNNLSRVHSLTPVLEAATQELILIDHHLQPSEVFAYGISDSSKSSTCEMVYDFIDAAGDAALVNEQIATCIYTGMLTDTGSFRFPSTSARVHEIIMHLKNKGLQHHLVHEAVYDNWTLNRLQFMGFVLSQKMQVFPELHSGIIALSSEEMERFQLQNGDTEGLVNYPLSIQGIKFAALITEKEKEIRLSLRSKGNVDVNTLARTHFSGGGHFNAAGGKSNLTLTETITKLKEILNDLHELK
ncbi:MAG: DHH family phosphoesterase [Bacteroidota bacterium]